MDREESLAADWTGPGGYFLRRTGGNRSPVFPEVDYRTGRRPETVFGAAPGGPRRVHPRRLLQLPFADDPPVPRRDRTLWPLFGGWRICLRPPVPVGFQAHRP